MSLDITLSGPEVVAVEYCSMNYTHNVTPMWELAGVYEELYNRNGAKAGDIVQILKTGILNMELNPAEFKKLNPPNGWGDYDDALRWLKIFTKHCEDHPNSTIEVSK